MDRINSKLNIAKEEISEFEDHGKRNHLKWNLKKKKTETKVNSYGTTSGRLI